MTGRQLDLFSGRFPQPKATDRPETLGSAPPASELSDAALIAAIPAAGLADASVLAAEAARRRLAAAVPALERLCRRFTGFGAEKVIPEQAAALEALATIGGREAAAAVVRIIGARAVEGPAVRIALAAAVRLGATLPRAIVPALLRHADRRVRADACRSVGSWPEAVTVLVDLLDDLDGDVAAAAASALGRLGKPEGKRILVDHLRTAPSAEVIDAVVAVADEECVVLLARIARRQPALAAAARDALEQIDHPLAAKTRASLP
jgi:HEAT repeats